MDSATYSIANSLIAHLRNDFLLTEAVMADPWDDADQCTLLQASAEQHDIAVAVSPMLPTVDELPANTASVVTARLAVTVFTTAQVSEGTAQAKMFGWAGRVLARILQWRDAGSGIPYADPKITSIRPFNPKHFYNV